jgi:hypothetical protein
MGAAELIQIRSGPHDRRPVTRADCKFGSRPCPFVGCRHHLYLEVNERSGDIKIHYPEIQVWQMKESCSLDVADRGGATLADTGATLNITRERVRQIEEHRLNVLAHQLPHLRPPEDPQYLPLPRRD